MNTERAPTDCRRPIREWQTEYDDQGGREGWMVTLECGHRYWLGAETSDGRPDDVWCQFCETRAGHPVEMMGKHCDGLSAYSVVEDKRLGG
jgi:hypothetical protein